MSKNTRTRIILTAVAALLLVTMAVGGTVAWMQATTQEITNTFTESTIKVDLTETDEDKEFQVIPGVDIAKDPKVTVTSNIDCYVFVRVTEANWNENLDWDINTGWNELTGVTDVYWRKYDYKTTPEDNEWYVLKGDATNANGVVTVKGEELTVDEMNKITANNPTLKFETWVVQYDAMTNEKAAWDTLGIN